MGASATQQTTWEPMELTYVGHVGEVLQVGMGKLSMSGGDPGEPRKQKGCEPDCPHT
jgi:hypothetical protein